MAVSIRPCSISDLAGVQRLHFFSLGDHWDSNLYETLLDSWSRISFVAEDVSNHTIVGYVISGITLKTNTTLETGSVGFIHSVAVASNYQRQGIGTRLLRQSCTGMIRRYGMRKAFLHTKQNKIGVDNFFCKVHNFNANGKKFTSILNNYEELQVLQLDLGKFAKKNDIIRPWKETPEKRQRRCPSPASTRGNTPNTTSS